MRRESSFFSTISLIEEVLCTLRDEWKDTAIGGAIFREDIPYILHENGATLTNWRVDLYKGDNDLRTYDNSVKDYIVKPYGENDTTTIAKDFLNGMQAGSNYDAINGLATTAGATISTTSAKVAVLVAMKEAQNKLIIRLVAAVALFLVPTLVQVLLSFINATTCTIG